jgi:hypothetical protein
MSEVINLESFDYAFIDNFQNGELPENSQQHNKEVIDLLFNVISNVFLSISILLVQHINLSFLKSTPYENPIDCYNIVLLLINFTIIPLSLGAMSVYDCLGSFAAANSRYKQLRKLLHRTRISVLLIYFTISVPLSIYAEQIINYILGLTDEFHEGKMFIQMYIHVIFIYINYILNVKYLHILGLFNYSISLCLAYIIISTITGYYLICVRQYGLLGIGYSMLLSISIMILISLHFMNKLSRVNINTYKVNKKVFQNPYFFNYLRLSIGSGLTYFMDYLLYMLIIVEIYRENIFYNPKWLIIDYLYIMKSVANGASLSLTSRICLYLTINKHTNIRNSIVLFVKILGSFCILSCAFNMFIFDKLITNSNITDPQVIIILKVYTFYIFVDYGLSIMSAITRSISKHNHLTLLPQILIYFFLALINFMYQTDYKSQWYIYMTLTSVLFMLNLIWMNNIDWKKEVLEMKNYINEEKRLEIYKFYNYYN